MALETVKAFFAQYGMADRVMEFDVSSATVELAAQAVGCESGRIAKTLSFLADGHASGSVIDLCRQSGAQIIGMGFLVEKGFAKGGQFLRDHGINYHALATIKRINDDDTMVVE